MKKFFNDLKINGVEWSECSTMIKWSAVLTVLTYLIIVATLVKIAVFSSNSSVSALATVFIILLCNSTKITYKK